MEGRIFLTGGTGSLGTAILARAEKKCWDCQFTVFSRVESKQAQVRSMFPRHNYVLGDVSKDRDVQMALRGHDIVIHAAAYKDVPQAERNSSPTIDTNIIGSRNIASQSMLAGVKRVIGISTDKACAPVNMYGASKMAMEKLFQDPCNRGATQFNLVRYGNVLGSTGSVIPLFRQQVRDGKDITVTDDRMTRFWLTLDDAVDLVLKALEETEPGTIIIPKAPASDMATLAQAVAPGCRIRIIGIRPGEKMHEQLLHSGESMHAEDIGEHFRIYPATSGYRGTLPDGFEYRSDLAPQVRVRELREMLVRSGE